MEKGYRCNDVHCVYPGKGQGLYSKLSTPACPFPSCKLLKKLFVFIWGGWHLIQDVLQPPKENLRTHKTKSKLVFREETNKLAGILNYGLVLVFG